MHRFKLSLLALGVLAALGAAVLAFRVRPLADMAESSQPSPAPAEPASPPAPLEPVLPPRPQASTPRSALAPQLPPQTASVSAPRADPWAQLRERFRALASGDPKTALRAARQLTDETERETALLTLLAEWKHGELAPPRQRAWAIAGYGLEAGLALELAGKPELAQLWTNELTDRPGWAVTPEHLAAAMLDIGPTTAFAFGQQLPAAERRRFVDAAFASWAIRDTDAALQWAEQLPEPTEREAALKAIRSVAPAGIGIELGLQDGRPVIGRLFPGSPAELGGELHAGDRILAVAQGDYAFVDARQLEGQKLLQAIRGTPGTVVQLQVLPAGAPPDSPPRMISVVRGQYKFKQ